MNIQITRGTQFVFVPTHAAGDVAHADCLHGFIAKDGQMGHTVLVYFWRELGVSLRTVQPVATDVTRLVFVDIVEQDVVGMMRNGQS